MIAPQLSDALARWLDHSRALKGAADNTIDAYQRDVLGFLAFIAQHHGGGGGIAPLARLTVSDMRAWMAHERGRGVSARSLARSLSAVKGFIRWLADRDGFDPTAVLSTRAPKVQRKLPRPLAEDAAEGLVDQPPRELEVQLELHLTGIRSQRCKGPETLQLSEGAVL